MVRIRCRGPEQLAQIQVVNWVKANTDLKVYHFGNERKCSWEYGITLKAMGVTPGVSDLFFPKSNKEYKGLWIELKCGKGKLTEYQNTFIRDMLSEGYMALGCWESVGAIHVIKTFYQL